MSAKFNGRRGLASGLIAATALCAIAACTTTSTTPGVTPSNGSFLSLASRATTDADRVFALQEALRAGENAYQAHSGLGEVYLRQANSGSSTDRVGTYCNAASSYASAAAASNGAMRADALSRRADALLSLYAMRAPGCPGSQEFRDATAFLNAGIAGHEAAIAADASAERRFALANAYRSAGMLEAADDAYTAGLNAGATGSTRAAALAAQAEVRMALPSRYSSDQILATLEQAAAADPNLPQVNVARGAIYVDQRQFGPARQAFAQVRDSGARPSAAGQVNPTAEAYYYLSVIDTLDTLEAPGASGLASAVSNAEAAVRNGGADPRYQRQGCLAYIMRGQVAVEGDDATAYQAALTQWCGSNGNSPDGLLLRGASSMRLAQYAATAGSSSAHDNHLIAARSDFGAALRLTQGQPESANWLRLPGRGDLWMRDVQDYGARVINVCFGAPADPNDPFTPQRSARADIEAFYRDYKLNVCRV